MFSLSMQLSCYFWKIFCPTNVVIGRMVDIAYNISITRTSRVRAKYFYFRPRLFSTPGNRCATVSNAKHRGGLEKRAGDMHNFMYKQLTSRL